MNRNNIWIHIGIAVILITLAAVLGQIGRWRAALRIDNDVPKRETALQVPPVIPIKNDRAANEHGPGAWRSR